MDAFFTQNTFAFEIDKSGICHSCKDPNCAFPVSPCFPSLREMAMVRHIYIIVRAGSLPWVFRESAQQCLWVGGDALDEDLRWIMSAVLRNDEGDVSQEVEDRVEKKLAIECEERPKGVVCSRINELRRAQGHEDIMVTPRVTKSCEGIPNVQLLDHFIKKMGI